MTTTKIKMLLRTCSIIVFILSTVIIQLVAHSHSLLSSFRSENIVPLEKNARFKEIEDLEACPSVLAEAILLLRSHFIKRHFYSDVMWVEWHKELSSQFKDPHQAIRALLTKFNDPYTRFIDVQTMRSWKQSLRGVSVGVGIILRRRLHLEDIGFAFKIATKVTLPNKLIALLRKPNNSPTDSKSVVADAHVISSGTVSPRSHSMSKGRGRQLFQTLAQIISRSNSTFHEQAKHQPDISRNEQSSRSLDSYFSALPSTRMTARQKMWTLTKVLVYSTLILQAVPALKDVRMKGIVYVSASCFMWVLRNRIAHMSSIVFPVEILDVEDGSDQYGRSSTGGSAAGSSSEALRQGDRILSVDGVDTFGRSVRAVKSMLNNGSVGEIMQIRALRTVRRRKLNASLLSDSTVERYVVEVSLIRDYRLKRKISYRVLPAAPCGRGVGYLLIKEFTDESFREVVSNHLHRMLSLIGYICQVTEALDAIQRQLRDQQGRDQALKGLVIDLRGNPGGALASALDVASLFLKKGTVLMQMATDTAIASGKFDKEYSRNRRPVDGPALLLLTDGCTASASEILVEALCENRRATSMGSRTVGKNKAQAVLTLSDGSGISFTVREYFTPTGRYMGGGHLPTTAIDFSGQVNVSRHLIFNESTHSWRWMPAVDYYLLS